MIKVSDIVNIIEEFAPPELAYSWDNTGLIIYYKRNGRYGSKNRS